MNKIGMFLGIGTLYCGTVIGRLGVDVISPSYGRTGDFAASAVAGLRRRFSASFHRQFIVVRSAQRHYPSCTVWTCTAAPRISPPYSRFHYRF